MAQRVTDERLTGDYLFKFQFFVHECALTKDFFNIAKPALALRFLDFPTLILDGNPLSPLTLIGSISQSNQLVFAGGKKCNFKMNSEELREALSNKPFFIMFIDAQPNK